MGTSISQSSPKGSNWRRVEICYEREVFSPERVINEIWRACENEANQTPISKTIRSDAAYVCFEAVKNNNTFQAALNTINSYLLQSKSNSIVMEFAKRAVPMAFQGKNPAADWPKLFFSEITNYIISRDTSGFVGSEYRNKNVKQLIDFKRGISDQVKNIVDSPSEVASKLDWDYFVTNSIEKLKNL